MNKGWTVRFKTRTGKDGVVSIFTNDSVAEVVDLQPGNVPFETEEDNTEDLLAPVRTQSGYIRVIDNGDLSGLMPKGNKERYVEYTENDEVKWIGWMQPDTFTEPWDSTPLEVELPIVSPLGVLGSEYLSQEVEMSVLPIANYILEIVEAAGFVYGGIYIPKEFGNGAYNMPLLLEVSRYNFFTENDAKNKDDLGWMKYNADDCRTVLEEICKFFGWTACERGNMLYFVSRNVLKYQYVSLSALIRMSNGTDPGNGDELTSKGYHLPDMELAGSGHNRSLLQGKKKISVIANVNPVGEVVPVVNENELEYNTGINYEYKVNDVLHMYEEVKLYNGEGVNVTFAAWDYNIDALKWEPMVYHPIFPYFFVGAGFVEYDRYSPDDLEGKTNYDFKSAVRLNNYDTSVQTMPTDEEAADMGLMWVKSQRVVKYTSGAFVLSGSTTLVDEYGNDEPYEQAAGRDLYITFRIGDKYWNGSGWGTTKTRLRIKIDYEGKKIKSTKTLDMPYNGADGYVMPINEMLSGEAELVVYAMVSASVSKLYIDNLRVEYYGNDEKQGANDDTTNKYAAFADKAYMEDVEIDVKMATSNNNNAGYGIVSYGGEDITTLYSDKWGNVRPEISLLNTAKAIYGRTTEKLDVELEKVDVKPIDIITREGSMYAVIAEAVDWKNEIATYTMEDLPL